MNIVEEGRKGPAAFHQLPELRACKTCDIKDPTPEYRLGPTPQGGDGPN